MNSWKLKKRKDENLTIIKFYRPTQRKKEDKALKKENDNCVKLIQKGGNRKRKI
jgi:hypothetical protein